MDHGEKITAPLFWPAYVFLLPSIPSCPGTHCCSKNTGAVQQCKLTRVQEYSPLPVLTLPGILLAP